MIYNILSNEMSWWLAGTAIIFTFVGRQMTKREHMENVIEHVLDTLIKDGYLKSKGEGKNTELLKYNESDDQSSK
jgi:hypothetical protein